jgi:acyl-CoA synthetase (AMP-forming)/AMP-acid ligase II
VAAPGRAPLTYAGLRCQVQYVADRLAQLGCRPDHRIALVLPNGPDMAVAFLGTALAAAAAPLNPAFRRSEFECLLRELDPAALITSPQAGSALIEAADACGVAVLRVVSEPDQSAGVFRLEGAEISSGVESGRQDSLILHTSGTTARPKQVPLTEANLCAGVAGIVECLSLTAGDCCLSIMPMFHIHGLMAGVLAPLAAGGRLFGAAGVFRFRIFRLLEPVPGDLVHRGSRNAPSCSSPRCFTRRGHPQPTASIYPILFSSSAWPGLSRS